MYFFSAATANPAAEKIRTYLTGILGEWLSLRQAQ